MIALALWERLTVGGIALCMPLSVWWFTRNYDGREDWQ